MPPHPLHCRFSGTLPVPKVFLHTPRLPYQLRDQLIHIDTHDYHIRSLLDRQQFSDEDALAADLGISSATWALFGVVWPSSRVLARQVSGMALQGLKVLEIGCGLGLTSIVLHRMGVDITASDYHPLAREFLERNVQRNALPPLKYRAGNWESNNPGLGEFDLIIGSDLLYQPRHAQQVSAFIALHSESGGAALVVDPDRGNRNAFTRCMLGLGFRHHFERFKEEGLAEARCKGRILHYQR